MLCGGFRPVGQVDFRRAANTSPGFARTIELAAMDDMIAVHLDLANPGARTAQCCSTPLSARLPATSLQDGRSERCAPLSSANPPSASAPCSAQETLPPRPRVLRGLIRALRLQRGLHITWGLWLWLYRV